MSRLDHRPKAGRRGLNPIHITTTRKAPTRRSSHHQDHDGPAHHTEQGRSHHRIIANNNDANIVILNDAQHARQPNSQY
jgi:hypothetical protein